MDVKIFLHEMQQRKLSHPYLIEEIEDLEYLCHAEIELGGSLDHERELCLESVNQLIREE